MEKHTEPLFQQLNIKIILHAKLPFMHSGTKYFSLQYNT